MLLLSLGEISKWWAVGRAEQFFRETTPPSLIREREIQRKSHNRNTNEELVRLESERS
jgi:hypothetical protein